jgi:DNA-binding NtrC family response regulator
MTEPEKITTRGYKFTCLIVEDDSAFGAVAAQVVRDQGGEAGLAATVAAAREAVAGSNFDLVLLDNHLPDGRGSDFFEQFFRRNPDTPVIMITGVPDLRDAVALTRNGLFDYLTKPVEVQALVSALQRARQRMVSREKASKEAEWFGESPAMKEVIQQLRQAARHPATTVLLTGETGTGKDLAARLRRAPIQTFLPALPRSSLPRMGLYRRSR